VEPLRRHDRSPQSSARTTSVSLSAPPRIYRFRGEGERVDGLR
jgi:hypothetical protein